MSLEKSSAFLADVEGQAFWYGANADLDVAEGYLQAVEVTCKLLERHPELGPNARFKHPRLKAFRFVVLAKPFSAHLLFYEIVKGVVIMRRAMRGSRNLQRRLREALPPKPLD